MPAGISVIIPALDEEASIARAIRSCREAGTCEVIVVDGGAGTERWRSRAGGPTP